MTDIKRSGSQPSQKGAVEYFSGTVRIDPLNQAAAPARVACASATFEPVRAHSRFPIEDRSQLGLFDAMGAA